MAEGKTLQEMLEESQDELFQQMVDRQEGRVGLAETKNNPGPTQSELDQWNRKLDKLAADMEKSGAHRAKSWRRLGVVAAIAVLLMIGTVAALQIRILNVVETIQEKFTQLSPEKTAEETVESWEDAWLPAFIPEDFMLSDAVESEGVRAAEYTNSEGVQFTLYQYAEDTMLQLDTEDAVVSDCPIGESMGQVIQKGGWAALYWDNSNVVLCLEYDPGEISANIIQQVARSVALNKT